MKTYQFFDKILGFTQGTFRSLANTILGADVKTIGATYTLNPTDSGKIIEAPVTATITLPKSIFNGFNCSIVNVGAGVVTLVVEEGALRSSVATITTQYNAATVYKQANVWTAIGGLD